MQRRTLRREPLGAREEREVGKVGAQVEAKPRHRNVVLDARRLRLAAEGRDDRRRPAPKREIALGGELCIRADDDPARDTEIGGERSRRGKLAADGQLPLADQRAQLPLDLEPERPPGLQVERQKWSC